MKFFRRQVTFYLVIALLFVVMMKLLFNPGAAPEKIAYNEFIQQIGNDQVKSVTTYGDEIEAELKDDRTVTTIRPDDHTLSDLLLGKNIPYETNPPRGPSWWQTALTYVIPLLLLFGLFFFFMQQTQGGGSRVMNFGKSRARLHEGDRKRVSCSDVAGTMSASRP